jgi:hypothetical protein
MEKEYKITITIEELKYTVENKYPDKKEIFTQVVNDEDMTKGRLLNIINAVNGD